MHISITVFLLHTSGNSFSPFSNDLSAGEVWKQVVFQKCLQPQNIGTLDCAVFLLFRRFIFLIMVALVLCMQDPLCI